MDLTYSSEFYLDWVSIILAGVAAVAAIYLIPLAGKARAWLLFSAAMVLLAIDRVIESLGHAGMRLDPITYEIINDMLGIGMAGCLLGSVYYIRDIFLERKLSEEKIRTQQELTAQIIETIPMRVFWKDRDSRFLGCNTLFAKDAGLIRPDELIGKTDFEMGWKDQAELYRADDRRVMDSNTSKLFYDEPQTTPAGVQIWLRTSKVPLRNEVNETIGVLGVYEDITEYKQMELQLLESEERFRKAFQNSAIGMALVGLDGSWLKINDSLCQIVGYSEQELLGKTFQGITHPDDLQIDLDFVAQLLAGEIDHYQMEKRYFHKDGHVVWIRLSVSLIRDAQDNPIHFVSQIEDVTERKQNEEALRASQARYISLFCAIADAIYIHAVLEDGAPGKFLEVNDVACRQTGYTHEELLGMTPVQLDAPDSGVDLGPIIQRLLDGVPVIFEQVHLAKDGRRIPVELHTHLFMLNGRPTVISMARDITERKRSEQALQQSEAVLRTLIEHSPVAMIVDVGVDADEKIIMMNQKFTRLFGYTMEDLPDVLHWWPLAYPDEKYREEVKAEWIGKVGKAVQSHSDIEPMETTVSCKNGSNRYIRFSLSSIGSRNIITFEDLTERKHAEMLLLESEEKFKAIFDNATDGILLANVENKKLLLGNATACRMLGYTPEEISNLHVMDIHPKNELSYVMSQFARIASGDKHAAENIPVKRKDGSIFYAEITPAFINIDGKTYQAGFFRDITERKQVEEKIRKLNEELETKVQERTQQLLETQEELVRKEKLAVLGQVAGSVGHELRNPLGVMSNAVYFLQTVLTDADDSVKEYLNIIKDEIAGSERIVSDLLDSVRIKPPHPEMVGVAELIGQTLRKCSVPPSVTVKQDIPETLSPLRVDAQQIHQVLRNLISNGVEAMPEGGVLAISAVENKPDETVTVSVRDSGTGMTPEQLGKLFQPLFTTKARGIGLGLVVVKNLTEANGGTVEVQSEVGKGTLFTVTLPAAEETGVSI